MPKKTASLSLLEKAAQQLAGEMGLEYVDTELVKEPGGRFLRIYIDQPGGITLEQLESYHRQIRSAADDIDYDYMEVSSPGADRPLKKPRDFERTRGKSVEVKLYAPLDGAKQLVGTLQDWDENSVTLEINQNPVRLEFKLIALIRPFVDVESELEASTDL